MGAAYRLNLTIAVGLSRQMGNCLDNSDPRGLASGLIYIVLEVSSPIFSDRKVMAGSRGRVVAGASMG